ncbi:MAG: hypothetical protein IKK33_10800 [Lachnospiraceae bacterium]|nr:hypothetical protein [Lachnospiraceae bacterium]
MKEQAVQKINKIGKISSVVTLICKILVGMGIGILLLASIVCFVIPKNSIRIVSTEKVTVGMDYSRFGSLLNVENIEEQVKEEMGGLLVNSKEVVVEEVEVVGNMVNVTQEGQQFVLDIHDVAGMTFILAIMLVLVMITLIYAGGLCKAFRDCQSPFEENVIKRMQHFAYSLIPWIVASSVIEGIGSKIMSGGQNVSFSIDLGMILVVLVVFLLVYIFKYGAVLQQESDETL